MRRPRRGIPDSDSESEDEGPVMVSGGTYQSPLRTSAFDESEDEEEEKSLTQLLAQPLSKRHSRILDDVNEEASVSWRASSDTIQDLPRRNSRGLPSDASYVRYRPPKRQPPHLPTDYTTKQQQRWKQQKRRLSGTWNGYSRRLLLEAFVRMALAVAAGWLLLTFLHALPVPHEQALPQCQRLVLASSQAASHIFCQKDSMGPQYLAFLKEVPERLWAPFGDSQATHSNIKRKFSISGSKGDGELARLWNWQGDACTYWEGWLALPLPSLIVWVAGGAMVMCLLLLFGTPLTLLAPVIKLLTFAIVGLLTARILVENQPFPPSFVYSCSRFFSLRSQTLCQYDSVVGLGVEGLRILGLPTWETVEWLSLWNSPLQQIVSVVGLVQPYMQYLLIVVGCLLMYSRRRPRPTTEEANDYFGNIGVMSIWVCVALLCLVLWLAVSSGATDRLANHHNRFLVQTLFWVMCVIMCSLFLFFFAQFLWSRFFALTFLVLLPSWIFAWDLLIEKAVIYFLNDMCLAPVLGMAISIGLLLVQFWNPRGALGAYLLWKGLTAIAPWLSVDWMVFFYLAAGALSCFSAVVTYRDKTATTARY
jgi:hypothetical protein